MLTLRAAAAALAGAADLEAIAALAPVIGYAGAPVPMDAAACDALGILGLARRVSIVRGRATRRLLLVEAEAGAAMRELVRRIAARVSARAPQLDWMLVAAARPGTSVAIAAWAPARPAPRISVLVADRARIVDSDAETLRALSAASGDEAPVVHARCLDVLGRGALGWRFYRALEARVRELADGIGDAVGAAERSELALLCVSRLLFLSFLEAKGWLGGDHAFLLRGFERCMASGGDYHRRVLDPLLFGTLNTAWRARAPAARAFGRVPFLNGGLFARTALERRTRSSRFPDDALGRLFGELLCRYRFTAREDRADWSEAAVDPEMLGRAFESLMASRERQETGAFYTPQPLVETMTAHALAHALATVEIPASDVASVLAAQPLADERRRAALLARASRLRLLDPACGSGAFLVHALERLAALRVLLGDARPVSDVRRETLTRSIFGVDLNATAVWLCELRLWLSVVIELDEPDPMRVPALPNLDRHVRVGDALAGRAFARDDDRRAGQPLARLRDRYVRATGARKARLRAALDREERRRALAALTLEIDRAAHRRREALALARTRDLFGERGAPDATARRLIDDLRDRLRELRRARTRIADGGALPFAFAAHFADVADAGGFDVVIGNPPWVRPHHLPASARVAIRRDFVVAREAAWLAGARAARAGAAFAGQVDLAALFVERSFTLLRPGGVLGLLLPAKLWRSLAGGGVRSLLERRSDLLVLEDWSRAPASFDATVYPSMLVARRAERTAPTAPPAAAELAVHGAAAAVRWRMDTDALPLDHTPGSPWLLLPPSVRRAFERIGEAGLPLARLLGAPILGVKCGANDAFLVEVLGCRDDLATIRERLGGGAREAQVERAMLRPLVRGEDVRAWRATPSCAIVWTHDAADAPLERLPPLAAAWLAPWRPRLAARTDARHRRRWWSLFRTEGARHDVPRVVWADIGRAPRAAVLDAGECAVPLNSCYVARCPSLGDALALAALLNGPIAAAWLAALAEPARGGYQRFLGWTLARLPLPADWSRAVRILAPIGERATAGTLPLPDELLDAALAAYHLDRGACEPLLAWTMP